MKQRRIEILILFFTAILIVVVTIIGSITFRNLKLIERQTERIYEPNQIIINLKLLLAELRNSENCVRAYGLYRNEEYLQAYQASLEQIDRCFDSLYFYQKSDKAAQSLLDATESLVEEKVLLLNKQLSYRNEEKVVNEVNRIKLKLDKFALKDSVRKKMTSSIASDKKEKKRGLFRRLFQRKEAKGNKASDDSISVAINRSSLEGIKTEVSKVKHSQSKIFKEMNLKGLELEKEDKIIWARLTNILNLLESRQTILLHRIAGDNILQTEKTHRLTLLSGISILFMLSFLALFSIYYFYSERKHRKILNQAVTESHMLAKARETFLANMSHEMRTPLNAIIGFTEQLGATHLDSEQKKELEIINSASKHLLGLVNDVLDLSKIEAEKITFEKIPFNPKNQIKEAVEFFKPKITDKHLEATLEMENAVPTSLLGDPLRLKQVILNLLSNSIKFTSKGGIKIIMGSQPAPHDKDVCFLKVSIEDTGTGIAPEMIDKIFDNFVQADSSINRKFGGTGLGLSITKKIIELQGGEIKVESKVNSGTRISFKIPFKINTEHIEQVSDEKEIYIPTTAVGKKILIADDESFNRALLITILRRWNINYEEAENGKQVLDKVNRTNYDVILMDLRMPEISGIEASKIIRQLNDPVKSQIPIIALTAAVSDEKRKECLKAGMNDLLTKPYKEAKLLKIIEQTIEKTKANEKI
ncbi:MAG: response regulator [Bacteroidia bacterium]